MVNKVLDSLVSKFLNIYFEIIYFIKSYLVFSKSNNNAIVVISELNVPRIGRLLKFLVPLRTEKFYILVHYKKFHSKYSLDNNVKVILFKSRWHLHYLIKKIKPKLIHGVESRSVFPSVALNFKNIPFIFDFQDLYTIYYDRQPPQKWLRQNLKYERACLTNSDYLISYSLEFIPVRKKIGLNKSKKVLYFPFYLDDELLRNDENLNYENRTIQLVYLGGISAINEVNSFNFKLIGDKLLGQNININIYPSPNIDKKIIQEYLNLQHPNLTLHESINQDELPEVISKYDFGLVPFFNMDGFLSPTKFRYSTTLKLFNYLEAGIPVIVGTDTEYQAWIVNHYKVGLAVNNEKFENLSNILDSIDYSNLKMNSDDFQNKMKMSVHINKVNNIYNKLIK
jgi:hypothetical protein